MMQMTTEYSKEELEKMPWLDPRFSHLYELIRKSQPVFGEINYYVPVGLQDRKFQDKWVPFQQAVGIRYEEALLVCLAMICKYLQYDPSLHPPRPRL